MYGCISWEFIFHGINYLSGYLACEQVYKYRYNGNGWGGKKGRYTLLVIDVDKYNCGVVGVNWGIFGDVDGSSGK